MPRPLDLLPFLLSGAVVTVELTVGAAGVACVAASLAGLGRLSRRRPVRWLAGTYIEAFRGTSALVQLFWAYFALPLVGISLDAMTAGVLALGLNTGAYGAEVVRGAIRAVPQGQHEAALALNLTNAQKMRSVILPQALVAALPPAGNLLIEMLKNTSLVSLITISELTFRGQMLRAETLRTVEIFGLLLIVYFLLALLITSGVRALERRLSFGMDRGGGR
ncbi:MAG: ectoine/hydroxyectoine ABC transporter permease subunit EhuC [Candidatus Handelsmanbacteria bacterium RIFCSPLOWO2_12_FULL_64_10]|uniref:Ectoine/hydroxyectoine ABC transporter permease subunit EhuC n=1 Tax=Handelsmanbacteria sp. (strain RIFCSPLOWO2_12_FULL_64_10) TaxID=1817868 RepID=A0A1F6D3Z4_HANXR|nr:MAG: ectoine/hydroxyectoine ABC transporter permease subunit EhuC [Candidatus Handelsmanbacteria bacterium RIFCSPLOWO2_12_FULL_64_10]